MKFATTFLVVMLKATLVTAGWQGTEWGTSIDAFIKASGGGSALSGKMVSLNGPYTTGSLAFTENLMFTFDSNGEPRFSEVRLSPQSDQCGKLQEYLISKYGTPIESQRTLKWKDNTTASNLELTRIGNSYCHLTFSASENGYYEGLYPTKRRAVRWGTALQTFMEASGGGRSMVGKTLTIVEPYTTGSLVFTGNLIFRFNQNGVAGFFKVLLHLKDYNRCGDLEEHLIAKYGAPIRRQLERSKRMLKWRDSPGGNNLELTNIGLVFCTLEYSPLDLAADKGL